jgi:hypothetical protein
MFCYRTKVSAKLADLVKLIHKFMQRSCVGIFHNEHTDAPHWILMRASPPMIHPHLHQYLFDNTTWSYYSCSCSSAYPSSKFTLKMRFIIFIQWRYVHSCFTQEQWIGSKGKRHRAGWFRTAGQTQLVMTTMTSSGLHFGCSSTSWKAYQIYFPKHLELPQYLFGVNHNHQFTTVIFSHGAPSAYLGPMGRVSC